MSKAMIIILSIIGIFFVIGVIVGDYHCTVHFCNAIMSTVNLAADIVKTEAKGITFVLGGIAGFVGQFLEYRRLAQQPTYR